MNISLIRTLYNAHGLARINPAYLMYLNSVRLLLHTYKASYPTSLLMQILFSRRHPQASGHLLCYMYCAPNTRAD